MALALHLHALGLVRYPPDAGGDVAVPPGFIVEMPSTPDACVLIRPRPGFPSGDMSGYELAEQHIVVRARADAGYRAGYDQAKRIRDALHGTGETVWAAGTEHEVPIAWCNASDAEPVWLGRDEQNRPMWSVSIQTEALITMEV
ncbi:minor capsid protein [Kibdelosporangium phytohabitans]|nr:minor capsid protein [Kibdelosporangium phytohabitans]